ncbi:MAG: glycoside hydrolase family 32 protein [Lachnospiraceae bacterium]|nr:glycoside hydrolase family 32 protein [Lachnospiraceae bacterium]
MSEKLQKAREWEQKQIEKIPMEQRPVFHFSVPAGWMNDPNGFSSYKGEYHLFFQYYPYEIHWNSMHWGHSTTRDFITWEYLPAALAPDEAYDNFGVFSGGAVEADGKQYLMYTGVEEKKAIDGTSQIRQRQCVAVGDGRDYEKLACNPVITADALPEGSSREDFRDPKVWKEDGVFYSVIGSRHPDGSGQIALFSSENMRDWRFCTILDRCENRYGKMWECPDFFPLENGGEKRQILMTSPQDMQAEGLEFHNGNGTIFVIGDYDKAHYDFQRRSVQAVDYGLDFYAPQTLETEDGRRIMIAWLKSWDNDVCPEGLAWSGMMTVPRELTWRDGRVCQNPVRELENYRRDEVRHSAVVTEEETEFSQIAGRVADLELEIRDTKPEAGRSYEKLRIKAAWDGRFYSLIEYDRREKTITFDRTYSGRCRDIISSRKMKVEETDGRLKLRILLDRYSCELFVNDGMQAMTALIDTHQEADRISFAADGEAQVEIRKYTLF